MYLPNAMPCMMRWKQEGVNETYKKRTGNVESYCIGSVVVGTASVAVVITITYGSGQEVGNLTVPELQPIETIAWIEPIEHTTNSMRGSGDLVRQVQVDGRRNVGELDKEGLILLFDRVHSLEHRQIDESLGADGGRT